MPDNFLSEKYKHTQRGAQYKVEAGKPQPVGQTWLCTAHERSCIVNSEESERQSRQCLCSVWLAGAQAVPQLWRDHVAGSIYCLPLCRRCSDPRCELSAHPWALVAASDSHELCCS